MRKAIGFGILAAMSISLHAYLFNDMGADSYFHMLKITGGVFLVTVLIIIATRLIFN